VQCRPCRGTRYTEDGGYVIADNDRKVRFQSLANQSREGRKERSERKLDRKIYEISNRFYPAESCAEVRCEEGKKCVVRRGRPRCVCSPECKAPRGGGGPVCGTDGKSYKSLCRLKKRACKKGSHELAVAYNGHCQSEYI